MIRFAFAAALAAAGAAACCILPMSIMLMGLAGSWLGVFGKAAAWAPHLVAAAILCTAAAWLISWQRGGLRRHAPALTGLTALNLLAWVVWAREAAINNCLITLM